MIKTKSAVYEPYVFLNEGSRPLATFPGGQAVIITGYDGGRRLQARLASLGLFPGQRLIICQNNDGALVVSRNGNRLVLGRGISHKILGLPAAGSCERQASCPCWPDSEPGD